MQKKNVLSSQSRVKDDEFKRRQSICQTIYVSFYIRFYYEWSLSRVIYNLSLNNFKFMAIENLDLGHFLVEASYCRLIFFSVISYTILNFQHQSHITTQWGNTSNIFDTNRHYKPILMIDKEEHILSMQTTITKSADESS